MWLIAGILAATFLAVLMAPARLRPAIWVAVIVAGVVPWFSMTGHAHWPRIGWIPFSSPPIRLRDIVLNAALYFPFGYFWRRPVTRAAWHQALLVAGCALCLSAVTELTQVYSHGRFPSMTDVTMNTVGAWAGAVARRAVWPELSAPSGRTPPSL